MKHIHVATAGQGTLQPHENFVKTKLASGVPSTTPPAILVIPCSIALRLLRCKLNSLVLFCIVGSIRILRLESAHCAQSQIDDADIEHPRIVYLVMIRSVA